MLNWHTMLNNLLRLSFLPSQQFIVSSRTLEAEAVMKTVITM